MAGLMSDITKKPFWESKNEAFVTATAACDLLHPESRKTESGDSLTETQYLKGRSFALRGEIIAAADWRTWHNFQSIICLARWECNALVTHGDVQECQSADYIRLMHS
jgi:hypothetical protein